MGVSKRERRLLDCAYADRHAYREMVLASQGKHPHGLKFHDALTRSVVTRDNLWDALSKLVPESWTPPRKPPPLPHNT